ncbi:hypothetical protein [Enterococcus mundtii]|uniref:Uncharacterized protein n=1 Tax=Enterococcus mundtii TaxID=53346 RepID=A0A2S7RT12_ENTMU|nr:hypothetical protein [Enterococcus mundtii]PQF22846.1 hypothetical protein CUS89_09035 [Enterococcus mundtii]
MRGISSKNKLDELILKLRTISDEQWCDYQFQRELLVEKVSLSEQQRWGALARECGKTLAETINRKYCTRNIQELWRFFGYRHQSKIRALSEIAAMSFSEKLNNVGFSPYVLEVAMTWPYDPQLCEHLVQSFQSF